MNNQGAGEIFQGIKEQLEGKIMGKPDLVEHGRLTPNRQAERAGRECMGVHYYTIISIPYLMAP